MGMDWARRKEHYFMSGHIYLTLLGVTNVKYVNVADFTLL